MIEMSICDLVIVILMVLIVIFWLGMSLFIENKRRGFYEARAKELKDKLDRAPMLSVLEQENRYLKKRNKFIEDKIKAMEWGREHLPDDSVEDLIDEVEEASDARDS